MTKYVGVNIDWSESFVDENGGFYCGTTPEQKEKAKILMPYMDLVINTTDFHSINGREFAKNGGMWPLHNVAEFRRLNVVDYGLPKGTTISPLQTRIIEDAIDKTRTGIVVPRHVYFQDGNDLSFTPDLVEEAFGERIITPDEFMAGNYTYLIAPKMHFDATTIISDLVIPQVRVRRVPDIGYTAFDLVEAKYANEDVIYVGTGVVDNICRHHTTSGLKQKTGRRVINVIGATTELYGIGLGFEEKEQTREATLRMQRDIGIEHKTIEELIEELEARK